MAANVPIHDAIVGGREQQPQEVELVRSTIHSDTAFAYPFANGQMWYGCS
jgi:hypothetical protein